MVKIIEFHKASWMDEYISTKEERIVTLKGNAIYKTFEIGETYIGKIFAPFDRFAKVNMTIIKEDFSIVDQLITSDGVDIKARFSLTYNIINSEDSIRKAIANINGQKDLIIDHVTVYLQGFISKIRAIDIRKENSIASTLLKENLKGCKFELGGCFNIQNIIVSSFTILNADLNEIISKSIKETELENANNQLTRIKLEEAHFEQSLKLKEAEYQIQLDQLRSNHELELNKLKDLQYLEIEKTKKRNQIEVDKEYLEVEQLKQLNDIMIKIQQADVMKTEQGKYAYYGDSMFEVVKKELELKLAQVSDKQKILTQLMQLTMNATRAHESGQLSAMKAVLGRQYNFNNTDQIIDGNIMEDINEPSESAPHKNIEPSEKDDK